MTEVYEFGEDRLFDLYYGLGDSAYAKWPWVWLGAESQAKHCYTEFPKLFAGAAKVLSLFSSTITRSSLEGSDITIPP